MRAPRRRLLAVASVAGVLAALAVPAAAQAAYYGTETDYAVASSPSPGDVTCRPSTGVWVCFKPYGDVIYVLDNLADGYAAVAEWTVWDDANTDNSRTGSCVNKLGAGKWGICNKNFPEGRQIQMFAARYNSGNFVDENPSSISYTT